MTKRMDPEEKFCAQRLRNTERFLRRAQEVHGDRFDYSQFLYVNAKTPSTITCRIHGPFHESPDKHLNSKYACPRCWHENRTAQAKLRVHKPNPSIRVSPTEYLKRLNLPAHIRADMSNYQGMTLGTVTLICDYHGRTTNQPNFLLRVANRCAKCGHLQQKKANTKPFDDFLRALAHVHGDRYTIPYPEEYENRKSWITVVCDTHGAFSKRGQKLLAGQGCLPCRIEELTLDGTLSGGYNSRFFTDHPELRSAPATVYYLRVGMTYKIGITRNKLQNRLNAIKAASATTPILLDEYACTLEEAYTLEQTILHDFHLVRTLDTWSTELFTQDVMGEATLAEYAALVLNTERKV